MHAFRFQIDHELLNQLLVLSIEELPPTNGDPVARVA